MKCLTPMLISTDVYKTNGSFTPGIYKTNYFLVPCGKCVECLKADQNDWALRLMLENETSFSAYFITLTFDDAFLPDDGSVSKRDVQMFLKRVRRQYEYVCDKVNVKSFHLSYYAVGEYGRRTNRPHYHIMLFGLPIHDWRTVKQLIDKCWTYGFTKVEPCCTQTCGYICKYMGKYDPRDHTEPPFRLMSRRPGLAFEYFKQHPELVFYLEQRDIPMIHTKDGKNHRVPRSIKRKFYSNDKKQKMREFALIDGLRVDNSFYSDFLHRHERGQRENERRIKKLKTRFYDKK